MALRTGRVPETLNTDQGIQFTSKRWIEAIESKKIAISMDGKGRFIHYYNTRRPHASLDYKFPMDVYFQKKPPHPLGFVACEVIPFDLPPY